jgi:hypothetical protein
MFSETTLVELVSEVWSAAKQNSRRAVSRGG